MEIMDRIIKKKIKIINKTEFTYKYSFFNEEIG